MDEEIRELWDMGSIESYWAKLHVNNAKLRARVKAGQKPCNLCEGRGHREVAGREAKCELCNGSRVQPKAKLAGAESTSVKRDDAVEQEATEGKQAKRFSREAATPVVPMNQVSERGQLCPRKPVSPNSRTRLSALCFDATRRVEESGDMSPHSKTLSRQLIHGPNACERSKGGSP